MNLHLRTCRALTSYIYLAVQPQVVTCSGARNTGSLRVIRTEANYQELARLDGLAGITDIWPIKSNSGDR